ncbi:hypothetical protein FB192DRAFT_1434719 [Mucor lusitanicus]|uniref:DH domain-containing protein n=1 Tax=Mucor circinelloides f. lusitanicus TaxID=29924 RepID=A0A8H4BJA3_MUCCL|nr:hypothetical protein FB192DRAFT_1434719 [Mucor lusitanicus]
MGNKTNKQTSSYGFLKPSIGGIHKKTYGSSRVGKKAKEMVKKNLSLFLKGINLQQMINYSTTNDPSSSSSSSLFNKSNSSANFFTNFSIKSNQNKLAANEIDDEQCHQAVSSSVNQEFALHASPSWQYVASTVGEPRFPHVDALPRTWKESLTADQKNSYCFTAKQMKYQELVYEIILTEQSYVDDLILVYKIFIKEALQWDGLSSAVRNLFENIFQIIRLHMQLLRELRAKQLSQYPVVSSITDICRSYISRFDIYSAYFSNFEKANNIIAESIRVQDEFGSFISRRSLWKECRNLPLTAYLLTPIQRVMKYPLFFRSLSECLLDTDGDMENIQCFLMEMDVVLRYFEKQKKESEDFIKLEDLASRISGLEGSTVRIAEYGRRLIYEGYLTIIPGTQQNLTTRFDNSSNVSFSSAVHPPPLSRRSSSFSLSSARKQKRTYVFLFNDMIVCTRERSKRRMSVVDNKVMAPPPRKESYYGPSADTLFKITHTPGRITLVDRAVMRPAANSERLSRRGSALFQSLRRYGSRSQEEAPSNSSTSASDLSFSVPHHSEQPPPPPSPQQQQPSTITYEKHPTQFICSIATKNLTNIQFEAETPEEKDMWCSHLESVLGEHVQRNYQQQEQKQQNYTSSDKDTTTGIAYQRATLSPTQSSYSFESNSSNESLAFSSVAWNGYCDIEKMDIDDEALQQRQQKPALNPPLIIDKTEDIMSSIMDEFGDSIWSIGAPAGLSPYQLRKTFSNIGTSDV